MTDLTYLLIKHCLLLGYFTTVHQLAVTGMMRVYSINACCNMRANGSCNLLQHVLAGRSAKAWIDVVGI